MPGDWFTCSRCRQRFQKLWTDEEARQEMERTLKPLGGQLAVLCDDCYAKFISWARERHPEWLR